MKTTKIVLISLASFMLIGSVFLMIFMGVFDLTNSKEREILKAENARLKNRIEEVEGKIAELRYSDNNLFFRIEVETLDDVISKAESYKGGNEFCIDHGVCDANFDSQDFVKGFNNLKSVLSGDGRQEALSSEMFESVTHTFYNPEVDELKTIRGRKFVVFNNSFIQSGEVLRSYITYINNVKVTLTVVWERNSKMDSQENLHQYDAEADAIVERMGFGD